MNDQPTPSPIKGRIYSIADAISLLENERKVSSINHWNIQTSKPIIGVQRPDIPSGTFKWNIAEYWRTMKSLLFCCPHYGKVGKNEIRYRVSQKCGCQAKYNFVRMDDGTDTFCLRSYHSEHVPHEGWTAPCLTEPEQAFIDKKLEEHVKHDHIKASFRQEFKRSITTTTIINRRLSILGDCLTRTLDKARSLRISCILGKEDADGLNSCEHLFFGLPHGKSYYEKYGTYVTFMDGTSQTNYYGLCMIAFTTVDNNSHIHPIGFALVPSGESEQSTSWAISSLLKFVNDQHPQTIVTDGAPGFLSAIAKTLPKTRHCLCQYHIRQNLDVKLSNNVGKDKIKSAFKAAQEAASEALFDTSWKELEALVQSSTSCGSKIREYVSHLYEHRRMYANAFVQSFIGHPAHIDSQAAESYFGTFKCKTGNMPKSIPDLIEVAYHIDEQRHDRVEDSLKRFTPQPKSDFWIFPKDWFNTLSMEGRKHLMDKFQLSANFQAEQASDGRFIAYVPRSQASSRFEVTLESRRVECSCTYLHRTGLPCEHILSVMNANQKTLTDIDLPNISFWIKGSIATRAVQADPSKPMFLAVDGDSHIEPQTKEARCQHLLHRLERLKSHFKMLTKAEGDPLNTIYADIKSHLDTIDELIPPLKTKGKQALVEVNVDDGGVERLIPVKCPQRERVKGIDPGRAMNGFEKAIRGEAPPPKKKSRSCNS